MGSGAGRHSATGWLSGDARANGIRIHWTRTGGALPPVVLAHGFTDDGPCWTPLALALAGEWDVVMLDARGHGRSAAPAGGYDPVTLADDLASAIGALGLERPAVIGHSMGGTTALVAAGRAPGSFRTVIAEDPAGSWWWPARPRSAAEIAEVRRGLAARRVLDRDAILASGRTEHPGWSEDELRPWADSKRRVHGAAASVFDPAGHASVDWPAAFGAIEVPVFLLGADPASGSALSDEAVDAARRWMTRAPEVRLTRIEGAGHSVRRDRFDAYLQAVRAHLATTR
jgi:N-formylmaleamate deformylase